MPLTKTSQLSFCSLFLELNKLNFKIIWHFILRINPITLNTGYSLLFTLNLFLTLIFSFKIFPMGMWWREICFENVNLPTFIFSLFPSSVLSQSLISPPRYLYVSSLRRNPHILIEEVRQTKQPSPVTDIGSSNRKRGEQRLKTTIFEVFYPFFDVIT